MVILASEQRRAHDGAKRGVMRKLKSGIAHAFFESAYNTKEDVAMPISSVNMRLNAGQSFLK